MSRNQSPVCFSRCLTAMTGLLSFALFASAAWAQDDARKIEVVLETGKAKKVVELPPLPLRPGTNTPIALDLKNRAGELLEDVSIKIVQITNDNRFPPEITLGVAEIKELPEAAGKAGHVVQLFKGAEKNPLAGPPPYRLQVQVKAKTLPLVRHDLKLEVLEPREYIVANAEYDATIPRLDVSVTAISKNVFIGGKSVPAVIVPGPDITPPKGGNRSGDLTINSNRVSLNIQNFGFRSKADQGEIYLNVDGYDRAFSYLIKQTGGAVDQRPLGEIRVRIVAPRYALPMDKFPVRLEIDGPVKGDYKVELSLDRFGKGNRAAGGDLFERHGLREQIVTFSLPKDGKEGKLLCGIKVNDWTAEFKTSGISNQDIWLRLNILKNGPKGYQNEDLILVQELRPDMAQTKSKDPVGAIKNAFAQVSVDESLPEGVQLILPPENTWAIGKPLEVKAKVNDRGKSQAPIKQVVFYRGDLPKSWLDEKDQLERIHVTVPQKEWKTTIPAQANPGVMPVSVVFITQTGQSAGKTGTVTFIKGNGGTPPAGPFKIAGKVLGRNEPQPDKAVKLWDAKDINPLNPKALPKATVQSGPGGVFVFEKVDPGSYYVSSEFPFHKLTGITGPVVVPTKDQKDVTGVVISLK